MNERIQELFKQTALHRNDHTTEQRLYEVEKFAELIVRECISVYEHDPSVYHEVNIANILEHFGVET